jgi:Fic family protein
MTKDDIARLLHLFKEPFAQRHWTNLHGILTRTELDARKTQGAYAEAANPLSYLAEIFNNYD